MTSTTQKNPSWVKDKIPSNIIPHLKLIKTHFNGNFKAAFFAVRSGVEVHVYKKVKSIGQNYAVATLALIPGTVLCVNSKEYKCRANKAKVKDFTPLVANDRKCQTYGGYHRSEFKYSKGLVVKPHAFDMSPDGVCTSGIHFFFGKSQAQQY